MRSQHPRKIIPLESKAFDLSLSDLMAGLMAIFLLVLCSVTLQYTANDEAVSNFINDAVEKLENAGIPVEADPDKGIINVPEKVLFASGKADLSPAAQQVTWEIAKTLLGQIKDEKYHDKVSTIYIEGHTDNVPINNAYFASNWELSTQRAINTFNAMRRMYPSDMDNAVNARGEKIFSCSGYADTRPIASNDKEEGRSKNRRITIRVILLPPQQKEAE